MIELNQKMLVSRNCLFFSVVLMVLLFAYQYVVWLQNGNTVFNGLVIFTLKILPLTLVVPGIVRKKWRAHIWASFISLFYFLFACLQAFASKAPIEGYVLFAASIMMFISAMMYARWSKVYPQN